MKRENFFKPAEELRDPYHYKACGLDNIYLLNGYDIEEHDGEQHVFVRHADELHKAIGRQIVTKRKGLTGQEIRFLRNTLDLTQSELASELGNNAQSIARWEKGQVDVPGGAEKLLRVFFFAKLATQDELEALRDLIIEKLSELDEFDENVTMPASFILDGHWTVNVPPPHVVCC
jgi:DNA-binding transcriptional regulator YiaG